MNIKIIDKNGVTLKTKGKYCKEDISVSVDESILGGNIEVPTVTNLVVTEGIASWSAPDITSLTEYNPVISYIVNVNGTQLETDNNNLNITNYLVDGKNNISVVVKAILTHDGEGLEATFEYSPPVTAVLLEAKTPSAGYRQAPVAVGDKIYVFYSSTPSVFDTNKETITPLELTYPEGVTGVYGRAFLYENYIYIVGYTNIFKFNITTGTIEKLSTQNIGFERFEGEIIGTSIYLFGAKNINFNTNKFDILSETRTTLGKTSSLGVAYESPATALVDTNIYIFGGYNNGNCMDAIHKFDTTTEVMETLSAKLPLSAEGMTAVAVGKNIFVMGGRLNSSQSSVIDTIYKFDTVSQTIETLEVTLPNACKYMKAVKVKNNIYTFGGQTGYSTNIDTIFKISNLS